MELFLLLTGVFYGVILVIRFVYLIEIQGYDSIEAFGESVIWPLIFAINTGTYIFLRIRDKFQNLDD